ncbi:MAG: preprotein translocase subunit SecE [Candidatus Babeliales bacterium]|jgi:preprotein translocase subunit SecE
MNKVMTFFNEVKAELKKVTWPMRDELVGATAIVCIVVAVFAILLGTMDAFFSYIIGTVIKY